MTPAQPDEPSDRNSFGILAAHNGGMQPWGDEEDPDEEEEDRKEQEHNDGAAAAGDVSDGAAGGVDDDTTCSTAAGTSGEPDNSSGLAEDLFDAGDHLPGNDIVRIEMTALADMHVGWNHPSPVDPGDVAASGWREGWPARATRSAGESRGTPTARFLAKTLAAV